MARPSMDCVFFANTDSEGPESTTNEAIFAATRAVHQAESVLQETRVLRGSDSSLFSRKVVIR
jgi:hypothetical protein